MLEWFISFSNIKISFLISCWKCWDWFYFLIEKESGVLFLFKRIFLDCLSDYWSIERGDLTFLQYLHNLLKLKIYYHKSISIITSDRKKRWKSHFLFQFYSSTSVRTHNCYSFFIHLQQNCFKTPIDHDYENSNKSLCKLIKTVVILTTMNFSFY